MFVRGVFVLLGVVEYSVFLGESTLDDLGVFKLLGTMLFDSILPLVLPTADLPP